jgi:predicted TIM-barrel fold metal-dependent hydrolase
LQAQTAQHAVGLVLVFHGSTCGPDFPGRFCCCAFSYLLAMKKPLSVVVPALAFQSLCLFAAAQPLPEEILLKDYRPRSIFNIPATRVERAKYRAIDVHSHNYARTDADIDKWVQSMDAVGVEKTIILSGAVGQRFDEIFARHHRYPDRFEVWCGIDFSDFNDPGYARRALAELERCKRAGARGIGELSDKGRGMGATSNKLGMHIDDPRMDPILRKCAELRLPINIHVGEDKWMYEAMDASNDGLMNAWKWRIAKGEGVLEHDEVVNSLERAVKRHSRTTFIACHLANCCSDLSRVGSMLDENQNLFIDIGARFAELSPIPRTVAAFFIRYQDRVMYGTDMDPEPEMYRVTFRLLETSDEHFYPAYFRKYHWPMHAWALPDPVLKKIYRENATRLLAVPE